MVGAEDSGTGFRSICSLTVLSEGRRKLVTKGFSQLEDHDKALQKLLDVSNLVQTSLSLLARGSPFSGPDDPSS